MTMNYQPQLANIRMGLKEAFDAYSNEICYLILKDGTTVEIIPEMSYIDNQLQNEKNYSEFVEEEIEGNSSDLDYQQMIQKHPAALRVRDQYKKIRKPLKKTILKSKNEKEKEIKVRSKKRLRNINALIHFSENNEYLQCVNCKKYFPIKENENEIDNKSSPPKTPNNHQIQNSPKKNQQYIQPQKQDQEGYQPRSNHPQLSYQIEIPKKKQSRYQKYYQQIHSYQRRSPQPQRRRMSFGFGLPMATQFIGQIHPMFRVKKKNSSYTNIYNLNNDYYIEPNYSTEDNYYYPISAKKQANGKKIYIEYPSSKKSYDNINCIDLNVGNNLNFERRRSTSSSYTDNNFSEYMYTDNMGYYEFPYQNRKNKIPISKIANYRIANMENDIYQGY